MLNNIECADEYDKIARELLEMSDREAVVYGLSMLETAITESLDKRLIPFALSGNNWITKHNSFTMKLKIAYSVGLISEPLYNDLCTIAKIRNVFAHNPSANSVDQEHVSKHISALLTSMNDIIEAMKRSVVENTKNNLGVTYEQISSTMDASFTLRHVISLLYGLIKSDAKYAKIISCNAYHESNQLTLLPPSSHPNPPDGGDGAD
ncbi:hypothetical protein ACR4XJ_08740 [Nitratidesulfovibrio sp. D1]|uniref:hypothetical protein n=1 Tax=Nitratidesulfovibrio sp. D1 TaxID=3440151 RepID=UPI003EBC1517